MPYKPRESCLRSVDIYRRVHGLMEPPTNLFRGMLGPEPPEGPGPTLKAIPANYTFNPLLGMLVPKAP